MKVANLLTEPLEPNNTKPHYLNEYGELSSKCGAKTLGFHVESLAPKCFSAPYHSHTGEEELFIVLDGEAVVRCEGKFYKVVKGDLFFFPIHPVTAHNIYNHTDKPFRFFALANVAEKDACYYPDSKKTNDERGILQNGEKVGYYKDEEDPAKYWPAHALRGDV